MHTDMFCAMKVSSLHQTVADPHCIIIRGWVNLRVRQIAVEKGTVSYLIPPKIIEY
jgi:hypothetical protein